jgi:hypothetical protein
MKTTQLYSTPIIEKIKLDREISLQLVSTNPDGEPSGNGWSANNAIQVNDPFQDTIT